MARRFARIRIVRGRHHQPRPLLPRKHHNANGRAQPRLSKRNASRRRQLQSIPGEPKRNSCTRKPAIRTRSKTASGSRKNGCAAGPKRAPPKPKPASTTRIDSSPSWPISMPAHEPPPRTWTSQRQDARPNVLSSLIISATPTKASRSSRISASTSPPECALVS